MATVDQPTANPTNKLTAATLAGAAMAIISLILRNKLPEWYDPDVMVALSPVVAFLAGYLIRDHATTVVVQVTPDAAP